MDKYTFTVFTPTYNRAQLLGRVYDSLKQQTFKDFEWVVVDDGSTDGTKELIHNWVDERGTPIKYYWQPNSGKHVAINRGVSVAQGSLFVILDSDDWLAPHALERIKYHWDSIPKSRRDEFCGIVGLYAYPSGEVVGSRFPQEVLDSDSIDIRIRYRVTGDNFGANRTDVLRCYPFPEDLGRFVTESLIWNRIAQKYSLRFVNEVLAYKEYQPDGLSARSILVRAKSSKAARLYYKEFVSAGRSLPLKIAFRNYANYIRFSLHERVPLGTQVGEIPSRVFWAIGFPVGAALYYRDRIIIRREERR